MHQGLYTAASGALSSMFRQEVASNNLANLSTPAFKVDKPLIRHREAARAEDGLWNRSSNELLEQLGMGVMGERVHTSYEQAAFIQTGNSLDLALQGDGFFVVRSGEDEAGDTLRLTRDGRFSISAEGRLVTHDGHPVLDTNNEPIELSRDDPVTIETSGVIRQNGAAVAQLGVIDVRDTQQLRKQGAGLYIAPSAVLNEAPASNAFVLQGSLEQSGVNPIEALMGVTAAGRAAQSNIGMIARYDDLMDRAINTFGRIA